MPLGGEWVESKYVTTFTSTDPSSGATIGTFPVSSWADVDRALDDAAAAYRELEVLGPDRWAEFLQLYADQIERNETDLVALAAAETALPIRPRLAEIELPRTIRLYAMDCGWRPRIRAVG